MMKVVIQLVSEASLSVAGNLHASMAHGMVCFVGFKHQDNHDVIDTMLDKILKLRIFPDQAGKTNLSLSETNGQLLMPHDILLIKLVRQVRVVYNQGVFIVDRLC